MNSFTKKIAPFYKEISLCSTMLIALLSWLRLYLNEFQLPLFTYRYSTNWGVFLYVVFVVVLGFQFWSLFKVIYSEDKLSLSFYSKLILLSCLQIPFLSNDIFSYFYYGAIAKSGANPSLVASLQPNFFSQFVDPIYKQTISMYGSVSIALFKGVLAFSSDGIVSVLMIYRLGQLLLIALLFYVIKKGNFENQHGLKMCLYNPVFITLCIGQYHIEWLGYILVLLGVLFYLKEKLVWAILLIFLAVFVKFSFLFFLWLPFVLFLKKKNFISMGMGMVLSAVSVYFINLYAEVSFVDFVSSMNHLQKLRPSGTWHDIATFIISLLSNSSSTDANVAVSIYTQYSIYFKIISISFFLIMLGFSSKYKKLNTYEFLTITLFCLLVWISNRVFSWYFILMLPVFLLKENKSKYLINWLFISSCFYILSEASLIVPQKSIADILVVVFMLFAISYGFYSYFKVLLWYKKS